MRSVFYYVCAFLFACTAMYHLLILLGYVTSLGDSTFRHLVFILINLLGAWGFLTRHRYLPHALALLTCQQIFAHGLRAWQWWSASATIDWISLGIILVMPCMVWMLYQDIASANQDKTDADCPCR